MYSTAATKTAEKRDEKGIFSKGFGKIPKSVLFAENLTPTAKLVYAYLACYADKNCRAFPAETRIMQDLCIGEEKLRAALKLLKKAGKIAVEYAKFNVYTLLESLEKGASGAPAFSMLAKSVMTDQNLSEKSKQIYLFHACYADFSDADYEITGGRTYPRRSQIMRCLSIKSEVTYAKHFAFLVKSGYIEAFQCVEGGRFGVNDYVLRKFPDNNRENSDNKKRFAFGKTDEKGRFHPAKIVECIKNCAGKLKTVILDKIPKQLKNAATKAKNVCLPQKNYPDFGTADDKFDFEKMELDLRKNINYDHWESYYFARSEPDNIDLLDTILSTMLGALRQDTPFKIGGNMVSAREVHAVFLTKLNWNHIEYIIESIHKTLAEKADNGEKIRNFKAYLTSVIYNAPASFGMYQASQMNGCEL